MSSPEDLKISYEEWPTPIVTTGVGLDSRVYTFRKTGAMRVALDMPEGEFFMLSATDGDRTADYEELRPMLLERLLGAYERMKRRV